MSIRVILLAKAASITGVETFAEGDLVDNQGRPFKATPEVLQKMVENFKRFGQGPRPLHSVSIVRGHEAGDPRLSRTDTPADGWVKDCRIEDGILKTDWSQVDPTVAQEIEAGRWKKVSAEVYPDLVDRHGNSYGPYLRRLVLLGAYPPAVKGLADVPAPQFSEPCVSETRVLKFAEVTMADTATDTPAVNIPADQDHDELRQKAIDLGAPEDLLDGLDDDKLALLVDWVTQLQEKTAKGDDVGDKSAFAEFDRRQKELDQKLQALEKTTEARLFAERVGRVDADIKALSLEGCICPAELDTSDGKPTLRDELLLLAQSDMVHSFSEGGKPVTMSAYDLKLHNLRRRPKRSFGEHFSQPKVEMGGEQAELVKRSEAYAKMRNAQMQRGERN